MSKMDYWEQGNMIFVTSGQRFGLTPDCRTVCIGSLTDSQTKQDVSQPIETHVKDTQYTPLINVTDNSKLRAEPRAGEMLAVSEKNKGAEGKGINQYTEVQSHDVTAPPTLAELGITPMQSSRWQLEATIPEERLCVICGLPVPGRRIDRRYCSARCRKIASRGKQLMRGEIIK
jgi:predicted nucleic acid-binding Zn ribbon protein